jgi:Domain of unknown function (DUF4349)
MRAWRGWALAGAAGLALLAGCGGGFNGASGANNGGAGNAVAPAAPPQADSAAGGTNGGTSNGGSESTGTGGTGTGGTGKASPRSPGAQGAPLVDTRALIRNAELTVAVKDIPAQAEKAIDIVTGAGGEVFSEDRKLDSVPAEHRIEMVVQVPPKELDSVLSDLAKLGTEQSRRSSTQNVTDQVADVDARIRSAHASLDRVRALYARATTITDITAIEAQLSQREADLESLEAQQRSLDAQTAAATVTLHLVPIPENGQTPPPPPPSRDGPSGFVSAAKAGWHALAVSTSWLLTVLGAAVHPAARRRRLRALAPGPPRQAAQPHPGPPHPARRRVTAPGRGSRGLSWLSRGRARLPG